ncbi:transmembrane protein PMIS2 [Phodopus roborovskii]|uniref:Pmis2 protein n=1 Tax=Phodopus roborovskii TaxID=109678 RepID=A0AAV0A7E5_PHORO|nr:transmembrane protein PMIS2 [Phodopus roborovskii]CAH7364358.1 Pmis2 [Phodopus roborovskii]
MDVAPGPAERPAPKIRKPLNRPQTTEELGFYAQNHFIMTICAVILFPPFGLIGLYFSRKTNEANKDSDWEDAYLNSSRTIWIDVFGILAGLAIIYTYVLLI